MNRIPLAGRRVTLGLAGLTAVASTIIILAATDIGDSHAAGARAHGAAVPARTAKAIAFHDKMRGLWEAHGSWTHMVIVSFVGNLPNLSPEERVLLHNQVDIGNAVKPYYGRAAGNKLTAELRQHILIAADLVAAAKAGDQAG